MMVGRRGPTRPTRCIRPIPAFRVTSQTAIRGVVTDPSRANSVYAFSDVVLYSSSDQGRNWDIAFPAASVGLQIGGFAISSDGHTQYLLTNEGLTVSRDGGATGSIALESSNLRSWSGDLAVDPADPSIAYVDVAQRLYVTDTAGIDWATPSFLASVAISHIIADKNVAGLAYVLTDENSLYRTTDGGSSWGLVADLSEYEPHGLLAAIDGILWVSRHDSCGIPSWQGMIAASHGRSRG